NGIGEGAIAAIYEMARSQGTTFGSIMVDKDLSAIERFGKKLQAERTEILKDVLAVAPLLDTPTDGSQPTPLIERLTKVLETAIPDAEKRAGISDYLKRVITEADVL